MGIQVQDLIYSEQNQQNHMKQDNCIAIADILYI